MEEADSSQITIRSRRWNLNGLASKRSHSFRDVRTRARRYYFDRAAAARAVKFFQTQCFHYEGEFAGQAFVLERWQLRIVRRVFGWKHRSGEEAGTRVVRELYVEVPRKNGKSFLCSAFAAYLLFADKELGAQVITAAADTSQAAIVYNAMKQMVLQNSLLSSLVGTPYRASMAVRSTASTLRVLSSKPNTKHGLNLHGGIIDELHAHKDRELLDVLLTSTSSRRQPLMVYITTAGHDRQSICWEKHEYALGIINEEFEDDSFFGVIFAAEETDDWTDPATWQKANPNLGISKKLPYLEKQCAKAQRSSEYENTFKQLELNIWTEQSVRWLPMVKWDQCATPVDSVALEKQECFLGLDLSSTTDLTAMVALFPQDSGQVEWIETDSGEMVEAKVFSVDVIPYFWVPKDNLGERTKAEEKRFRKWIDAGFLTATQGAVIDYGHIRNKIIELDKLYNIKEIAMDPWNATQLSTQLDGDGFTVVPFRQGFGSLSAPSKSLLEHVLSFRIAHGGHPVLRWCAGNVAIDKDPAGNIKPSKKRSLQKIDGIIALVCALGRAIAHKDDSSVYDRRGLVSLG